MKQLHVYEVYLDDGQGCFKATIPAASKKQAIEYCAGNGEIVAVRDSDLQDIDLDCLASTLKSNGWGQKEIDVICRCLNFCGLARC